MSLDLRKPNLRQWADEKTLADFPISCLYVSFLFFKLRVTLRMFALERQQVKLVVTAETALLDNMWHVPFRIYMYIWVALEGFGYRWFWGHERIQMQGACSYVHPLPMLHRRLQCLWWNTAHGACLGWAFSNPEKFWFGEWNIARCWRDKLHRYCCWKKSGEHHLGCIKPFVNNGRNQKLPINMCRISSINSISRFFKGPCGFQTCAGLRPKYGLLFVVPLLRRCIF